MGNDGEDVGVGVGSEGNRFVVVLVKDPLIRLWSLYNTQKIINTKVIISDFQA